MTPAMRYVNLDPIDMEGEQYFSLSDPDQVVPSCQGMDWKHDTASKKVKTISIFFDFDQP